MSPFEMARWFSLIESIDLISNECELRGVDFNKVKISPLDIEKYVEGTCDAFTKKIEQERASEKAAAAAVVLFSFHNEHTEQAIDVVHTGA